MELYEMGTYFKTAAGASAIVILFHAAAVAAPCPLGTDPKAVASKMLVQWEKAHEQVIQRFGPDALSGTQGKAPFKAMGQYLGEAGYPTQDPDNHACLALVSEGGLDHVTAENLGMQFGGDEDYARTVAGLRKFVSGK